MKYLNKNDFAQTDNKCIGVLLVNLGTPDNPDKKSVRQYLKQFLWDPRVVEAPRLLWWLFLNVILLNTRPKKSAKAYQSIWQAEGSPLLTISEQQAKALQQELNKQYGEGVFKVELGMCYLNPSIPSALKKLKDKGMNKLICLPLYPQYSASTTAATFDAIADELKTWRSIPEFRMINHYYADTNYINALASSVQNHWKQNKQADKLMLSFHGIPEEYCDKGDSYYDECVKTAHLLAEKLNLSSEQWLLTFQSRLGPKQWLQPYTDLSLKDLASNHGVKSVHVICPGFSADCLETLEEIAIENKQTFIAAGGEEYQYIACLNDEPEHIKMMSELIKLHSSGW